MAFLTCRRIDGHFTDRFEHRIFANVGYNPPQAPPTPFAAAFWPCCKARNGAGRALMPAPTKLGEFSGA